MPQHNPNRTEQQPDHIDTKGQQNNGEETQTTGVLASLTWKELAGNLDS